MLDNDDADGRNGQHKPDQKFNKQQSVLARSGTQGHGAQGQQPNVDDTDAPTVIKIHL